MEEKHWLPGAAERDELNPEAQRLLDILSRPMTSTLNRMDGFASPSRTEVVLNEPHCMATVDEKGDTLPATHCFKHDWSGKGTHVFDGGKLVPYENSSNLGGLTHVSPAELRPDSNDWKPCGFSLSSYPGFPGDVAIDQINSELHKDADDNKIYDDDPL